MTTLYEDYLPFCRSQRQRETLEALAKYGSARKACAALGCHRSAVDRTLLRVKRQAAAQGFAPEADMTHTIPEPHHAKGVSTYYDKEGKVRGQWVKTAVDEQKRQEIIRAGILAMCEDIKPVKPRKGPRHQCNDQLLNCHVITDYHLGMMAWGEETGADWDLDIAEETLVRWFATSISQAPAAATGLLAQLGDFMHWDGMEGVTPTSGNILDVDTRFQKLVRVAIRVLRQVITLMLRKYPQVHVIMAEGNHDLASSVWLREALAVMYENEPRVSVDQNADVYYCYEHGKTSLFFHHGHKRKPEQIDDVFVAKYRQVFGRTRHSYAHLGHMHYAKLLETNLMVVEQHRTLAAPDAYASRGGWLSGREAKVISYHREFGKVAELVISPRMLEEEMRDARPA